MRVVQDDLVTAAVIEGLDRWLADISRGLDEVAAQTPTERFRRLRPNVAAVLGLGDDEPGDDAGGLVLAMFNGLLFQSLLDPGLAIEGDRMRRAQARLGTVLPVEATASSVDPE